MSVIHPNRSKNATYTFAKTSHGRQLHLVFSYLTGSAIVSRWSDLNPSQTQLECLGKDGSDYTTAGSSELVVREILIHRLVFGCWSCRTDRRTVLPLTIHKKSVCLPFGVDRYSWTAFLYNFKDGHLPAR